MTIRINEAKLKKHLLSLFTFFSDQNCVHTIWFALFWDSLFSFLGFVHLLLITRRPCVLVRTPHPSTPIWRIRHLFVYKEKTLFLLHQNTSPKKKKKNLWALVQRRGQIWTQLKWRPPKFPSHPAWGRPQIRGIFSLLPTSLFEELHWIIIEPMCAWYSAVLRILVDCV